MEALLSEDQASTSAPVLSQEEPGGSLKTPLKVSFSGFLTTTVHFLYIFSTSQGPEVESPPAIINHPPMFPHHSLFS